MGYYTAYGEPDIGILIKGRRSGDRNKVTQPILYDKSPEHDKASVMAHFLLTALGILIKNFFLDKLCLKQVSSLHITLLQNSFRLWRCFIMNDSFLSLLTFN